MNWKVWRGHLYRKERRIKITVWLGVFAGETFSNWTNKLIYCIMQDFHWKLLHTYVFFDFLAVGVYLLIKVEVGEVSLCCFELTCPQSIWVQLNCTPSKRNKKRFDATWVIFFPTQEHQHETQLIWFWSTATTAAFNYK